MDFGPLRAARLNDDGKLELEFWEGRPDDADIMTWFAGNTVTIEIEPISVVTAPSQ